MISMKWPPISCQSVFHFKPSGRTDGGGAARRDGRIACIAASARRPFACRQLIRYGASPLLPAAAVCCQPPPGEFYYHLTPRRRLGELVVVAVLCPSSNRLFSHAKAGAQRLAERLAKAAECRKATTAAAAAGQPQISAAESSVSHFVSLRICFTKSWPREPASSQPREAPFTPPLLSLALAERACRPASDSKHNTHFEMFEFVASEETLSCVACQFACT